MITLKVEITLAASFPALTLHLSLAVQNEACDMSASYHKDGINAPEAVCMVLALFYEPEYSQQSIIVAETPPTNLYR